MRKVEKRIIQPKKNSSDIIIEPRKRVQYRPSFNKKKVNQIKEDNKIRSPQCSSVKQNKQKLENDHQSNDSSWLDKFVNGFQSYQKSHTIQENKQKNHIQSTTDQNNNKCQYFKGKLVLGEKSLNRAKIESKIVEKKPIQISMDKSNLEGKQSINPLQKNQKQNKNNSQNQNIRKSPQNKKRSKNKIQKYFQTNRFLNSSQKKSDLSKIIQDLKSEPEDLQVTVIKIEEPVYQTQASPNINIFELEDVVKDQQIENGKLKNRANQGNQIKEINKKQEVIQQDIQHEQGQKLFKQVQLQNSNITILNQNDLENQNLEYKIIPQNPSLLKNYSYSNKQSNLVGKIKKNSKKAPTEEYTSRYFQNKLKLNKKIYTSPKKKNIQQQCHIIHQDQNHDTKKLRQSKQKVDKNEITQIQQVQNQYKKHFSPTKKNLFKEKIINMKNMTETIHEVSEQWLNEPTQRIYQKFSQIFDELDFKKLGHIDKMNCNSENLNDEIIYLIGPILSKIRYQQKSYDKNHFIQESEKIISSLQSHEINKILKSTFQNQNLNFSPRRSDKAMTPSKFQQSIDKRSFSFSMPQTTMAKFSQKNIEKSLRIKQNINEKNLSKIDQISKDPYLRLPSHQCQYLCEEFQSSDRIHLDMAIPNKQPYLEISFMNKTLSNNQFADWNHKQYLQKEQFNRIDDLNYKLSKYIIENKLNPIKKQKIKSDNINLEFVELRKHLKE